MDTTWIQTVCIGLLALLMSAAAVAQSDTLSPAVANDLIAAYELLEEDKTAEALAALNRILERRGDRLSGFERATLLQVRGSAHVQLDNLVAGLRDFEQAVALGALPEEQTRRLQFNVAQLHFATEDYARALEVFLEWLKDEESPGHQAYFMIAGAYYQLDQYPESLEMISKAIPLLREPQRRYYDLKNALLSELQRPAQRTELLQQMVVIWPEELSYWRQLSGLYLDADDERSAFSALESAYLAGLIEDERDIVALTQFYSSFNNPVRGAQVLTKEMEAERVEETVDNLQLLSQLWSQAREHSRAIPVLERAAEQSDTGMLSFRLGQALLAEERHAEAEDAFQAAIDKGELEGDMLAQAWVLMGNARFNQAGPGDRAQRLAADRAFEQAERFTATRAQARDWRGYISAINQTESRQAMLEREQSERLEEAARERLLTACRAQQLAGRPLSAECRELLGLDEEGQPANDNEAQ
jgi:tetratricopeptide (TPR) repeat protein